MSEKLPVVSGKDAIKALSKAGFRVTRQKGSHVRLEKIEPSKILKLTIPLHETLKKGTLRQIISDAGMSVEEFAKLLS